MEIKTMYKQRRNQTCDQQSIKLKREREGGGDCGWTKERVYELTNMHIERVE